MSGPSRGGVLGSCAIVVAVALAAAGCSGSKESGPIIYQGPEGLAVMRADGSGSRPALPPSFGKDTRHADWSPDVSRFAFTRDEADETRDIWIADANGSNARKLVDCVTPCRDADNPAWSPDGERIAFNRIDVVGAVDQGSRVQVITVASGEVATVVATTPAAEAAVPRWSPDGQHLVVSLTRWATSRADEEDVTGSALGVIDLEAATPTVRRLTDFALFADYPDWHPTDDVILFQAGNGDPFEQSGAPLDLYTIEPEGTNLTRLTHRTSREPWLGLPAWLPDGTGILVTLVRDPGDFAFAMLASDGTTSTDVVDPATGKRIVGAHARQAANAPS